jgi:ribosomal protein S18 acetylase RimI-like enzyme
VWEIGGVHTIPSARRRGLARRVVQTALATLLATGRTPRYQVEATNTASIQLAEALDLAVCLRFEHYTSSMARFLSERAIYG